MPKKIIHEEFIRNYCKENGIKLLEIPYTRKDELIKETIIKFLNE